MAVTGERSSLRAVSTAGTVSEVRSSFWMATDYMRSIKRVSRRPRWKSSFSTTRR